MKLMRDVRGWPQKQPAEMIYTGMRYISAAENGRGMGKSLLEELCGVFEAKERAFSNQAMSDIGEPCGGFSDITRLLLKEL